MEDLDERFSPPKRSWPEKFRHAFHGIWLGARGQSSFAVHLAVSALVIVAAVILRVSRLEWFILLLCITLVLAAEMFNSALEHLAKAIDRSENQAIARGLNIASAAVLLAAGGSAVIGAIIFVGRLWSLWMSLRPE
jgi:diacylglycerol kinase